MSEFLSGWEGVSVKEPPDTTPSHNYPFCCRRIELGENIFKTGTNPYS